MFKLIYKILHYGVDEDFKEGYYELKGFTKEKLEEDIDDFYLVYGVCMKGIKLTGIKLIYIPTQQEIPFKHTSRGVIIDNQVWQNIKEVICG